MAAVGHLFAPTSEGDIHVRNSPVFRLLLTVLVTLFDRVRPAHLARVAAEASRRIGTANPPGLAVAGANGPLRR
jgi:hypothetical protein